MMGLRSAPFAFEAPVIPVGRTRAQRSICRLAATLRYSLTRERLPGDPHARRCARVGLAEAETRDIGLALLPGRKGAAFTTAWDREEPTPRIVNGTRRRARRERCGD